MSPHLIACSWRLDYPASLWCSLNLRPWCPGCHRLVLPTMPTQMLLLCVISAIYLDFLEGLVEAEKANSEPGKLVSWLLAGNTPTLQIIQVTTPRELQMQACSHWKHFFWISSSRICWFPILFYNGCFLRPEQHVAETHHGFFFSCHI